MIPLFVFLLAGAAVYLGAIEASFSALMRLSLRLEAERSARTGDLANYLDDPVLLFAPVRVLLGLVTATATALLATAIGVGRPDLLTFVILSVAAFVVILELLVPLVIVSRDPERVLEILLPTFRPIARALQPFSRWAASAVSSRRNAANGSSAERSEEAAESSNSRDKEDRRLGREERRLLQSIVDFGGTLVREVMTPRPDIVGIREQATTGDVRALFREQEYSRFAVFRENIDNIVGFVFVKDLVALDAGDDSGSIAALLRPAVVVPESKRVSELLTEFQRQQTQIALVVDEYGGTAGLVTIEDLLEEIVGEIRDEYDVESEPIIDEGGGNFVVSGKVDIDEMARRLHVDIEREGFETVGGFLLAHLGSVPAVGERLDINGLSVEVLDVERRRINKVRISRRGEEDERRRVGERAP